MWIVAAILGSTALGHCIPPFIILAHSSGAKDTCADPSHPWLIPVEEQLSDGV